MLDPLLSDRDVERITGRARSTLQKDRVVGSGIRLCASAGSFATGNRTLKLFSRRCLPDARRASRRRRTREAGRGLPVTALDALAGEPRWVAWRNELRGGKATKVPYAPDGKKAKADDPSTWGARTAAQACAAKIINGLGGGIGIQLGDLAGDMHLGGLDLDSCIADDGALAPWAAEILSAVATFTERSPSGRGLKMFFCTASEDVRPFLDSIGVRPDVWGTHRSVPGQDGRDHGPAVEVYLATRYFAVTEDVWPGTPDTLATLDAATLDRLSERRCLPYGLGDAPRRPHFRGIFRGGTRRPAHSILVCREGDRRRRARTGSNLAEGRCENTGARSRMALKSAKRSAKRTASEPVQRDAGAARGRAYL